MPRAEAGTTKAISNNMKSKGLTRLRWYCQPCERAMRDENGFKMHCQTEGHVRQMQLIGENSRRAINDYSAQFQRDFLKLLRTSHGEKKVHANHFYQEYIRDKQHIHQNATRFSSLTDFVAHLGREGIVRVEENEGDELGRGAGLYISWVDSSPEALRKQDALRKKERQDRGDEERELQGIEEQIRRAREARGEGEDDDEVEEDARRELQRTEGEKIKLNFGGKQTPKPPSPPLTDRSDEEKEQQQQQSNTTSPATKLATPDSQTTPSDAPAPKPPFKLGGSTQKNKPKNVFAAAAKKSNPLSGSKKPAAVPAQQKPMSEAERIMKEEMERKRLRGEGMLNSAKRQRVG